MTRRAQFGRTTIPPKSQSSVEVQVAVVVHAIIGGAVAGGRSGRTATAAVACGIAIVSIAVGALLGGRSSRVSWPTHAQWVLGERKTDTSLAVAAVRARQRAAVQLCQRDGGVRHIFEFDKTHGSMVVA